ncbi:Glutathione S-transferase [Noviherbaspirillum humi]|uniref:Glutathione S-transferase n=1 Tax=Noviherbaspirillum humi TaxID=1688639 RepID=A0A239HBX9_9BURK|nr:glutathione S-transferase family protein [Noviherbaspirillum humi]SNS78293.1 Glutathione S-transferase [Noviherbaspirillum humi]
MADLILHHYPTSPFAEKIRTILGFKRLAWKSVFIPPIMPKPDLVALTGGYRRTPVLQIGADIYCDTSLISDVLERLQPSPSLYPPAVEGASRLLAQWADTALFWTVIPCAFQPSTAGEILAGMTPEQMKAFGADRAAFRGNAPRLSSADAMGMLPLYLDRLAGMLAGGQPFLFGDEASIADFSVYHCLWFLQRVKSLAPLVEQKPALAGWYKRVVAFGHHESSAMSSTEALAVARGSRPAPAGEGDFVDHHGVSLGDEVAVMPTDYGIDPVQGRLVAATASEFAVERKFETGTLVVHFPRIGFQLKKA